MFDLNELVSSRLNNNSSNTRLNNSDTIESRVNIESVVDEFNKSKSKNKNKSTYTEDKTYEEIIEMLSNNLKDFNLSSVGDSKLKQLNLIKTTVNNNNNEDNSIYFIKNNKLYKEESYKNIGVVTTEENGEDFINKASSIVYNSKFKDIKSVLETFKLARFRDDIIYIFENQVRISIDNPFMFNLNSSHELSYVNNMGVYQKTLIIDIFIDKYWEDLTPNSKVNITGINLSELLLLGEKLLYELKNDKLEDLKGKTISDIKNFINTLLVVKGNGDSLLDETLLLDKVKITEVLKESKLNWSVMVDNEYFTELN